MRLNTRNLQKIVVGIFCVWVILLFKNASDLPAVQEERDKATRVHAVPPWSSLRNPRNSPNHLLDGRRHERRETLERTDNATFATKGFKAFDLDGENAAADSNQSERNDNRTVSSFAPGKSVQKMSSSDPNLHDEQNYLYVDGFNEQKKRPTRGKSRVRREQRRKHLLTREILPPTILLPKPIIVMGFPKAGTSSLFTFFQKQGLISQHWYCCEEQTSPKKGGPTLMADCLLKNLRKNKSDILGGCGNFDVYSEINGPRKEKYHFEERRRKGYLLDDGSVDFDGPGKRIFFPQHFRIQELHESYPNATWILNWREFDSWFESVVKWGNDDRLYDQFLNEYYMQGVIDRLPKNNMTEIKEILKTIYYNHTNFVRDFVRRHPSHALVEVNITHKNASVVLAEAFGLDSNAWKNVNKNKKSFFGSLRATKRRLYAGFQFIGNSFWWILLFMTIWYLGWTLGFTWT